MCPMGMRRTGQALVVLVAALLSPGCSDASEDLDAARATWEKTQPSSFSYTYRAGCQIVTVGRVTVENGQTRVRILEGDPQSMRPDDVNIDALFGYAEQALRDADQAKIQYSEKYGYPERSEVDTDESAVDDECAFIVSDFRPGGDGRIRTDR